LEWPRVEQEESAVVSTEENVPDAEEADEVLRAARRGGWLLRRGLGGGFGGFQTRKARLEDRRHVERGRRV
jgi:hypothetical protein